MVFSISKIHLPLSTGRAVRTSSVPAHMKTTFPASSPFLRMTRYVPHLFLNHSITMRYKEWRNQRPHVCDRTRTHEHTHSPCLPQEFFSKCNPPRSIMKVIHRYLTFGKGWSGLSFLDESQTRECTAWKCL